MPGYIKPQKRERLRTGNLNVAAGSKKVKIRVCSDIQIRVDAKGLEAIEKRARYNRARTEADREASMEYAGMRYAR